MGIEDIQYLPTSYKSPPNQESSASEVTNALRNRWRIGRDEVFQCYWQDIPSLLGCEHCLIESKTKCPLVKISGLGRRLIYSKAVFDSKAIFVRR